MKSKLLLVFFLWLLNLISIDSATTKPINIYVDYCVYRKSNTENIVEIYYGFLDTALTYRKQGNQFTAELFMQLKFFVGDSLVDSYEWNVFHQKEKIDSNEEFQSLLVGQKNIQIESGRNLKFSLFCVDTKDSTKRFYRTFEVENISFGRNNIEISDIQFAQMIERADTSVIPWQNEFLKGKYYVIPNPTKEVIGSSPRLYTYFEYYLPKSYLSKQLKIEYRIYDALKEEALYKFKNVKVIATEQFDIDGFALDALPSGMYYFETAICDLTGTILSKSKSKKFYLFNPDIPPKPIQHYTESDLFAKSVFATLSDSAVQIEFEKAKYIASDYEKELFQKLTSLDGKRRFLFQFWRRRNPDTNLVYNKAYDEFVQKINYANRFFSVGNQIEGWKTDRGRVLIQYGEPTNREFYPREGNRRSYEVWFYSELYGGAYFYFVDLLGNGNYILVHSTAMNEISNENWYTDFVTGTNTERIQKMLLIR